jgi:uncharacterized protein YdeI (BOF family)
MRRTLVLAAAVLALAGCSSRDTTTLGAAVEGTPVPVASIGTAAIESPVVLQGSMTKKCPVAGCWFMLQDETGTIKVDTKNAGFVVVDVPLNARLSVAGRVSTNGTERFIDASGVRY